MIRIFLLIITSICFAINLDYINKAYNNQEYSKICTDNIVDYAKRSKDDGLLNLYAISCLKLDYINKLIVPINSLVRTKEARLNAVYYSTILYKKKLLYAALVDGLDISNIKLPKCDYVLSDIYDNYVESNFIRVDDKLIFNFNNLKYEVSLVNSYSFIKVIVNIFDLDGNLIETKEYW